MSRKNNKKAESRLQSLDVVSAAELSRSCLQLITHSLSVRGEEGIAGLPKPSPPHFIRHHHHHRRHHLRPCTILSAGEAHVLAINYR